MTLLLLFLLLPGMLLAKAKKFRPPPHPASTACLIGTGTSQGSVCAQDVRYIPTDDKFWLDFVNDTPNTFRGCTVTLMLYYRSGATETLTGTAFGSLPVMIQPREKLSMQLFPVTRQWQYAKEAEIGCSEFPAVREKLAYPVFDGWLTERSMRKLFGY